MNASERARAQIENYDQISRARAHAHSGVVSHVLNQCQCHIINVLNKFSTFHLVGTKTDKRGERKTKPSTRKSYVGGFLFGIWNF